MYIHPFWAGILLTIIVEMVVIAIAGFVMMKRDEEEVNGKTRTDSKRD